MKKQLFGHSVVPYIFIAPQLAIISIFFLWPAAQSVQLSFYLEDPWGLGSTFVWFDNYIEALTSESYYNSALFTVIFSSFVAFFSMAIALFLAVKADVVIRGQATYRVLLIWAYAVAPAVAGLMAVFLFNQHLGPFYAFFNFFWDYDHKIDAFDATFVLILVAVWKQVSVNFVYFLAGLQSIPKAVKEAAAIDCKSDTRRFWTIVFPLLAPTTFFLLIINLTYALFETFPIIDVLTRGRPGGETRTLVYKVYQDGFLGADLGGSSAQSVILMIIVMILTIIQFRYIERKIHY